MGETRASGSAAHLPRVRFDVHDHTHLPELANRFVLESYLGVGGTADGVHLLGPLAKKVVRIAPPLVTTVSEARSALAILHAAAARTSDKVAS